MLSNTMIIKLNDHYSVALLVVVCRNLRSGSTWDKIHFVSGEKGPVKLRGYMKCSRDPNLRSLFSLIRITYSIKHDAFVHILTENRREKSGPI